MTVASKYTLLILRYHKSLLGSVMESYAVVSQFMGFTTMVVSRIINLNCTPKYEPWYGIWIKKYSDLTGQMALFQLFTG
jgi:hypothetical protein